MRCPFCHNADSRVIDSREADEGATTRRRRSCPTCSRRFTTVEEVAYLRFASVYRSFSSVADFEREIAELKERQSTAGPPGPTPLPTGSAAGS